MVSRLDTFWILGPAALVAFFIPFSASAAKPVLEVWTALPNPQGVSSCPPCNRFWQDFRTDRGFYAALTHAFQIKPVYRERNRVEAGLKLVTSVPTFLFGGKRVVGYTSPEDLLARLGLAPINRTSPPPANPPPATAPREGITKAQLRALLDPYADRLNGLQSNLEQNAANLQAFARWLEEDKAKYESQQRAISDLGLQLQVINEQLGQINRPVLEEPLPEKTKPTKPVEPAEGKGGENPGIIDRVLELGRYPATWFLGPIGGAGLTALAWLYQRRKKKVPHPEGPLSGAGGRAQPWPPPMSPQSPAQQAPATAPPVPNIYLPSQAKTETVYVRVPVPDPREEAKRKAERTLSMSNAEAAAFFDYRDRLAEPQTNP